MMNRYTDSDECCGDTWHETREGAFHRAGYADGFPTEDFWRVNE